MMPSWERNDLNFWDSSFNFKLSGLQLLGLRLQFEVLVDFNFETKASILSLSGPSLGKGKASISSIGGLLEGDSAFQA